MKAIQIVNKLKEILPKYTNDFSDMVNIVSLTKNNNIITATTSIKHSLQTGDYITIKGAKQPIVLTSLTRNGYVATATSLNDNDLTDPNKLPKESLPIYIEISNASEGYNGVFELLTVPNNNVFTFKLKTQPTTPASVAGFLLLEDTKVYNGYKQITKINDTSFSYQSTGLVESPAQGDISFSKATRIDYSATAERIKQFYSENENNILQNWLFVVLEGKTVFKNDTVSSDISSLKYQNQNFYYETAQEFSIYIILPSRDSSLAGDIADKARGYETALLKSLGNYQFESDLTDIKYKPCVYNGEETDDYIKAYYVHRFSFSIKGVIQNADVYEYDNGVKLKRIEGSLYNDTDYSIDY